MSDLISKKELYHKLGEAYNKGHLSWGANEIFKDIIGECDSVENKGDLISRQAVDDVIYDYSRSCDVNYAQIMEYIDKIPSVENKGEWIPISERLPEKKVKDYLACCEDGYVATIMYDNGRWLINGNNVIAWMPLPEPYKAERGE